MGSGSYSEFNENKTSSHILKPESELSKSTQPQQIQKSSYLKIAEGVSNSQNSKNTALCCLLRLHRRSNESHS